MSTLSTAIKKYFGQFKDSDIDGLPEQRSIEFKRGEKFALDKIARVGFPAAQLYFDREMEGNIDDFDQGINSVLRKYANE